MNDTAERIAGSVTGVILAGGEARRMGGRDKGLVPLAGRALVGHVIDVLAPQVREIIINANRNLEAYARFGHRVIPDTLEGFHGPLAGMASALQAATTTYIATAPCDSPFLPADLVARLYTGLQVEAAEVAVAHDGERMQPVFSLIDRRVLPGLLAFLGRGERKIDRWYAELRCVRVDFADARQTFVNINTPEEIAAAEAGLAHAGRS